MLDLTKPVQTRDGRNVRILSEIKSCEPLVAVIHDSDGTEWIRQYPESGSAGLTESILDLVNVPEEKVIYLGIHEDGTPSLNYSETEIELLDVYAFTPMSGFLRLTFVSGKLTKAEVLP